MRAAETDLCDRILDEARAIAEWLCACDRFGICVQQKLNYAIALSNYESLVACT